MKSLKIILILLTTLFIASCSKDDAPAVTPAPKSNLAISSINPSSGPKNTTLLITGVDFSPTILSNTVTLNGKACTVNTASATTLSITIPRGAGSGLINVTVAGATVQTPSFEYIITPSVVSTFAGSTQGFADGTSAAAKFDNPFGLAIDATGNMYLADFFNNKIRKISSAGVVTTFAGSTQGFADGTGSSAQFSLPTGVCVDVSGNVYVADCENHRIRKINPTGSVTTLAGSTRGFADGNGPTAKFAYPLNIAVDNVGNVYVADRDNNKIRKISPTGMVTSLAGSNAGFSDGLGTAAQFNSPSGVAVDNSGNVYVVDSNNQKIRKITPTGLVSTLAGSTFGYTDGLGNAAQFFYPTSVTLDAIGNVYVADNNNHKIRKINPTGVVTTLAGSTVGYTDGSVATAQFAFPNGIAVDATGNVFIADTSNQKIRKITQD